MIIAFLGESINSYRIDFLQFLAVLTLRCPFCGSATHWHSWYARSVKGEEQSLRILRVRCCGCAKTHAVIPDFLSPYKQYPQAVQQAVLEQALESGVPVEQIEIGEDPQDEVAVTPPSVETMRYWIRSYRQKERQCVGALVSLLERSGQHIAHWGEGFVFYRHLITCFERLFSRRLRASCLLGQVNILLTISQLRLWI